ncbi:hypothetical protein ElyMa_000755700 [Elysia marginata]|uniref:Uncharacterized protein n=1 Tax=Elysia marginata TaxID=1093978 RepID=A0AAV4GPX1_9GAST|nr:hypothetical protein ElyMa_000755700 [Elysia marginata]
MFLLEVHMLAWCVMVVFILSKSVKGTPTVTLVEIKATTSCDNFQLAGQDYTQLKYNMTGANSNFKFQKFWAPLLLNLSTQNIWGGRGADPVRSDLYTFHEVYTEPRNKKQQTKSIVVGLWITFILFIVSTGVAVCLYFCLKGSHIFSRQSENHDG